MKKIWKCLVLGITCLAISSMPVYSVYSAKSVESELDDAKKEQNSLEKEKKSAQKTLDKLESKKENLQEYIKEIDADLNTRENEIKDLTKQLSEKETQIEETQKALDEAIEKSERQYAAMKERIRYVYENGNASYIEMILQAKSFADFLNRAELVSQVYAYDKNMLNAYQEVKESIAATKTQLENDKATIEKLQSDAQYQKQQLEIVAKAKEKQVNQYNAQITDMEAQIKAYDEEIRQQTEVIRQLEEEVKRQKAANGGAANTKYDGGMFKWPCPSSTRVTSEFGMRPHPIFHVNKMHNGIDIGASYGADIIAAYGGTVVASTYNSSMGNYIMIDHGSELYTIYMHCSSLLVKSGAKVTAGQVIAKVGSTGNSTGNHLHFGVRLNGSYVSPWNYLKK